MRRKRAAPSFLERVVHASAVIPGAYPSWLQTHDELFLGASEKKASETRVGRAEISVEETLEQSTCALRFEGRGGLSSHSTIRRLVWSDFERTAGIRLEAFRDPSLPVHRCEELFVLG